MSNTDNQDNQPNENPPELSKEDESTLIDEIIEITLRDGINTEKDSEDDEHGD